VTLHSFARVLLCAAAGIALSVADISSQQAQQQTVAKDSDDPTRAIADALTKAKASKRYVLLNFGADWCPECRLLAKILAEPEIATFLAANFIPVKVEVGYRVGLNATEKNLETTLKYGAFATPESVAIPFIVILDPDGKVLDRTNKGEWKHAPAITSDSVLQALKVWAPKR